MGVNILFINGVNTAFGGSGNNALKSWLESLMEEKFNVYLLNTVPTFCIRKKGFLLKILLILLFFPGSLFRFFKDPLAELLYKLSPFLLISISYNLIRSKYKYVVFSHYCIFIYAIISRRSQRVFIVQDLLYVRAKSLDYSRNFCKFIFRVEILLYSLAPNIICLSHDEMRILIKFLKSNVTLATCLSDKAFNVVPKFSEEPNRIAIISDWRRNENIHGLIKFFSSVTVDNPKEVCSEYWIYGISSNNALNILSNAIGPKQYKFYDGGVFDTYNDIPTKYFLVPIYQGAGIKLKTLEMFANGRFVYGTPGAFLGLPRGAIRKFSKTVFNPQGILLDFSITSLEIQENFKYLHDATFMPMGKIFDKL